MSDMRVLDFPENSPIERIASSLEHIVRLLELIAHPVVRVNLETDGRISDA